MVPSLSLSAWLAAADLARLEHTFVENGIDLDVIPTLTDADLRELGLNLGDRKRVAAAIVTMSEDAREAPTSPPPPDAMSHGDAGRRQLTVLFADLVGSTELSQKLDPEDLRDVIQSYQTHVAAAIRESGGYLAKYLGDGILAYFGYPQAREDAAEIALHAGLSVVAATQRLAPVQGQSLTVRVGIATGPVVVGDVVGEDLAREVNVVGETPNLAARLLGVAAPDQVVIAESTRRLIGNLFQLQPLGPQTLKGISAPVETWAVLDERHVVSRFEAVRNAHQGHFIGRSQEVGLLLDRWEHVKGREGQLVLLSGEAGIGKSRITDAFYRQISDQPHFRIRYQCSPQHRDSPLYPVVTQLSYVARIAPGDDTAIRAEKMNALLGAADTERVALMANLVGIPLPPGSRVASLDPARRRQETLAALATHLDILADQRPVMLLVEDAHWIDPSTQDLITLMVEGAARLPLLIVVTFRPEFDAPWAKNPIATQLALNRLTRMQIAALLSSLAQGKQMPADVIDDIGARSDGIPLYVEEMFGALRDSGVIVDRDGAYHLTRSLHDAVLPTTLQDSLMARLDRMAPAKAVAQVGSVIGREFGHAMLAIVASLSEEALRQGLEDLIASGLIFGRGTGPAAVYSFKHALVQDTAYQSLLRATRQQIHARIARHLASATGDSPMVPPEVVARHYMEGGDPARALEFWRRAAQEAIGRSAYREALAQLESAITTLDQLPDLTVRREQELDLLILKATALVALNGYGSEEVAEAYRRAEDVCRVMGDPPRVFPVLFGLARARYNRAEFASAQEVCDRLITIASKEPTPALIVAAHTLPGVLRYQMGAFRESLPFFEKVEASYAPELHEPLVRSYVTDLGLVARMFHAHSLWSLGFPERASALGKDTVRRAEQSGHPLTTCFAYCFGSFLHQQIRDLDTTLAWTDAALSLAEQRGFRQWAGAAAVLKGWFRAANNGDTAGIEQLRDGLRVWQTSGANTVAPYFKGLLADGLKRLGCLDEAMETLRDAEDQVNATGERQYEAELLRLKGSILAAGPDGGAEAEQWFRKSLHRAREQDAKAWELRSAVSLAALWSERGEKDRARDLLEATCAWFKNAHYAQDMRDARALLSSIV